MKQKQCSWCKKTITLEGWIKEHLIKTPNMFHWKKLKYCSTYCKDRAANQRRKDAKQEL